VYAVTEMHADYVFDTDDDNIFIDKVAFLREIRQCQENSTVSGLILRPDEGHRWANVMKSFGQPNLWPRGLPLHETHSGRTHEGEAWVDVTQWLVGGEPDLDAIGRIGKPKLLTSDVRFQGPTLLLDWGCWSPWNSQATLWPRRLAPYMWLPITCNSRVEDITRSYMINHYLWDRRTTVAYRAPILSQDRNPHDQVRDLTDELPIYLYGDRFAEACNEYKASILNYPQLLGLAAGTALVSPYGEDYAWGVYARAFVDK
jgi:hypothetical protein